MAGDPSVRVMVWVDPPLLVSALSRGSLVSVDVPQDSRAAAVDSIRLLTLSTVGVLSLRLQSTLPTELARIELRSDRIPPRPLRTAPPLVAWLFESVVWVTVSLPKLAMPPPEGALLPAMVLLVRVTAFVSLSVVRAPPVLVAVLAENVLP